MFGFSYGFGKSSGVSNEIIIVSKVFFISYYICEI